MDNIIKVENLVKKYGDFTAVDGISFEVKNGETFGILGPNGAGKTTTMEMIEGLKPLTSGRIFLDGLDVAKDARSVKSLIGVQLQSSSFFIGLNLKELLETFAAMYGRKVDAMELLEEVQLTEKAKNQAKELSGGQRQRLSIAVALVNDPKVIFLDEPTTGLDPQARRNLWDLVTQIKTKGKTVVLTTHYMDEAEVLCDRIAVMDHAKIVALDTTENLLKGTGINSTLEFKSVKSDLAGIFAKMPDVEKVSHDGKEYRLILKDPATALPVFFKYMQEQKIQMFDLQLRQPTLEDVFLQLTGHELRE